MIRVQVRAIGNVNRLGPRGSCLSKPTGGSTITNNNQQRSPPCLVGYRHFFSGRRNNRSYTHREQSFFSTSAYAKRDPGLNFTSVLSDPKEKEGPTKNIPSRAEQLRRLQDKEVVYDVLIIGGGATGAGCALDAATRGLNVACIERGDFASETSSRSTKLIWAGLKYVRFLIVLSFLHCQFIY